MLFGFFYCNAVCDLLEVRYVLDKLTTVDYGNSKLGFVTNFVY